MSNPIVKRAIVGFTQSTLDQSNFICKEYSLSFNAMIRELLRKEYERIQDKKHSQSVHLNLRKV